MPEINFYVGKSNHIQARLLFACKLVEKAQAQKLKTYIHVDSWRTCEKMDEVLWSFNDLSFIPHSIEPVTEELPVTIGHDFEPQKNQDFLINLSNQIPSFLPAFTKVAEVIDQEPDILQEGRKRYAYYRSKNYKLNYHQL